MKVRGEGGRIAGKGRDTGRLKGNAREALEWGRCSEWENGKKETLLCVTCRI